MRNGNPIEFNWHEKQREATATADRKKYTLYGGFRGPGKSYWLRWYLLRFILLCNAHGIQDVRVGLFCEDYPVLRDRQISKIRMEFPPELGKVKSTQSDGLGFHLNNGLGVLSLRNLDDPAKYMGAEFAAIGVDQIEKNPVETFNLLRGSLRWPGVAETRFVATANPGGIGHHWVKQYWIDSEFPEEMRPIADEFAFVRARPDDNPHLDASYWEMLDTLPAGLYRAWRLGDWDAFDGQVFTTWNSERHVCAPFALPPEWPKWRAIDWGKSNPWCCLWLAKEPDTGRVYVYREAYATGLNDREQAREVKRLTIEKVSVTFSDPSMWTKKSFEDRTFSTADEYAAEGVPLVKADNDRMTGKRKIDTLLSDLDDGGPGLVVFENCRNLIRTLPALPYDKANVEDVDSAAEDHAYDALRYGLTQIVPRPAQKQTDRKPLPAGRVERLTQGRERAGLSGKDF